MLICSSHERHKKFKLPKERKVLYPLNRLKCSIYLCYLNYLSSTLSCSSNWVQIINSDCQVVEIFSRVHISYLLFCDCQYGLNAFHRLSWSQFSNYCLLFDVQFVTACLRGTLLRAIIFKHLKNISSTRYSRFILSSLAPKETNILLPGRTHCIISQESSKQSNVTQELQTTDMRQEKYFFSKAQVSDVFLPSAIMSVD